jgi:hypothetical protein
MSDVTIQTAVKNALKAVGADYSDTVADELRRARARKRVQQASFHRWTREAIDDEIEAQVLRRWRWRNRKLKRQVL